MFIVKGLHSPIRAALKHIHINTIRASQWYVIRIRWLINHRRGTGLTVKVTNGVYQKGHADHGIAVAKWSPRCSNGWVRSELAGTYNWTYESSTIQSTLPLRSPKMNANLACRIRSASGGSPRSRRLVSQSNHRCQSRRARHIVLRWIGSSGARAWVDAENHMRRMRLIGSKSLEKKRKKKTPRSLAQDTLSRLCLFRRYQHDSFFPRNTLFNVYCFKP